MTTEMLQRKFKRLLKKICKLADEGNYIFRGESEIHEKVSSSLYREYDKALEAKGFSVETVQSHILEGVKKHTKEEDNNNAVSLYGGDKWKASQIKEKNDAILEELQHYGGKTNQIDFTTDYFIALFFACDAKPEKDGRIILLKKDVLEDGVTIYEPKKPRNRVIAQKSVFVRPNYKGVVEVEADKIIVIDKELKKIISSYLEKYHSITPESIYNDVHGFIYRNRKYEGGYTHLHRGLAYDNERNYEKAIYYYTQALEHYTQARERYTKAIEPDYSFITHYHRGVAYNKKGDYDKAIADFSEVIKLNSDYVDAYIIRSVTYGNNGQHDLAIADCNKAVKLASYPPTLFNRAIAYNRVGKHELAIGDLNEAIKQAAMNVDICESARVENVMQNYKGTKKDFKTILQLAKKQKNKPLADFIQKAIDAISAAS